MMVWIVITPPPFPSPSSTRREPFRNPPTGDDRSSPARPQSSSIVPCQRPRSLRKCKSPPPLLRQTKLSWMASQFLVFVHSCRSFCSRYSYTGQIFSCIFFLYAYFPPMPKQTENPPHPLSVRFRASQVKEIEAVSKEFDLSRQDVIRLSVGVGLKAMRSKGLKGLQRSLAEDVTA